MNRHRLLLQLYARRKASATFDTGMDSTITRNPPLLSPGIQPCLDDGLLLGKIRSRRIAVQRSFMGSRWVPCRKASRPCRATPRTIVTIAGRLMAPTSRKRPEFLSYLMAHVPFPASSTRFAAFKTASSTARLPLLVQLSITRHLRIQPVKDISSRLRAKSWTLFVSS